MKILRYSFVLAALLTSALAFATPRAMDQRDLAKFAAIRVEGMADVLLSQDNTQRVSVDADADVANQVQTTVENGILVIRTTGNLSGKSVKVYVSAPSINDLTIEGSGNIMGMTPLKTGNLSIALSGDGNVQLTVDAQKVTSAIFGTGNIDIAGTTTVNNVTIEGTGDFHGKKLVAAAVSVTNSGAGEVEVLAEHTLRVALTGSGDVLYAGDVADVTSTVSGTGTIRRLAKG